MRTMSVESGLAIVFGRLINLDNNERDEVVVFYLDAS